MVVAVSLAAVTGWGRSFAIAISDRISPICRLFSSGYYCSSWLFSNIVGAFLSAVLVLAVSKSAQGTSNGEQASGHTEWVTLELPKPLIRKTVAMAWITFATLVLSPILQWWPWAIALLYLAVAHVTHVPADDLPPDVQVVQRKLARFERGDIRRGLIGRIVRLSWFGLFMVMFDLAKLETYFHRLMLGLYLLPAALDVSSSSPGYLRLWRTLSRRSSSCYSTLGEGMSESPREGAQAFRLVFYATWFMYAARVALALGPPVGALLCSGFRCNGGIGLASVGFWMLGCLAGALFGLFIVRVFSGYPLVQAGVYRDILGWELGSKGHPGHKGSPRTQLDGGRPG